MGVGYMLKKRSIIIALLLLLVAVATAQAWEYKWGTANGGECAWGAGSCGSVGGPLPPPPTSSCTFDTGTFGTDCTF